MKRTLILFAFFISHICFAQNSSEEIIERIDNKLYVSENQSWTLEIYNVVTGSKIVTQNVSGKSVSINTSGWKKGLYAARATIGEEVLTEKIQVR